MTISIRIQESFLLLVYLKENNIKKMIHHANKVRIPFVWGTWTNGVVDWMGCRVDFDGGGYQETGCGVETLGSSC